ncbi:MAG: hypothetical protein J2P37_01365 [Ktedonobacteraceae bacterium]|nr:hypothetical protein [Ktedonobacteraceae bacterium]MBO0795575.1 hypothetical protein [Ktedonobacteraceae bacterium]
MRCRDAREKLSVQRGEDLDALDAGDLQEHLQQCSSCQELARRVRRMSGLRCEPVKPVQSGLSTERIMQAVQQQRRITQQFEDIRKQQQLRMQRSRPVMVAGVAIGVFTLSSIPLLMLAAMILQTNLVLKGLYLLSGVIDLAIILAQYLQAGLTVIAHNSWLLSGLAFAVVMMMGMWVRLMRAPREV